MNGSGVLQKAQDGTKTRRIWKKIMETNINNQSGATIVTLNPNPVAQAFIYDNEQRAAIVNLIEAGYKPHHTSVGVGKTGRKLGGMWRSIRAASEKATRWSQNRLIPPISTT